MISITFTEFGSILEPTLSSIKLETMMNKAQLTDFADLKVCFKSFLNVNEKKFFS